MRLLALVLAITLSAPSPLRPQGPPAPVPTIAVSAAEVSVDFVARDKKGRIVRDLKSNEIEVFEDGVRQEVGLFQLISSTLPVEEAPVAIAPAAAPGAAAGALSVPPAIPATAPPAADVDREAVVALVFDRLGPQARVNAHAAALDWLKLPAVAGRQVGVFRIDQGLEQLQEFTDDRAPVREALDDLEQRLPTSYTGAEERERLRGLRQKLSILEGRGSPQSLAGNLSAEDEGMVVTSRMAVATNTNVQQELVRRMTMTQIAMLQSIEALERDQQGLATTNALLALVGGLRTLPGRKAVVLFSEGLVLPPRVLETLTTVISEANRGGVSFYAVDAAGLRTRSASDEMRREMAAMAEERDAAGLDPTGRGSAAAMTKALERNEDVLRYDPASGLGSLARETGGFLIHDTNDISAGLKRVEEELGAYYLLSYAPRNDTWDGHYRRIEVRVRRSGVTVQARRGYFAVRTPTPTPVLDYEAPALARLEQEPGASLLPLRGKALHFPAEDGESVVAIVAQLPAAAPSLVRDKDSADLTQDFTILALVRDRTGRVVAKASRRYALVWPASKAEQLKAGRVLFEREARLGPGRYSVEIVAYDAQARKSGVHRFPLDVPAAAAVPRLGSLVVVGHAEPRALAEPGALDYRGYLLFPVFDEPVRLAGSRPLAFLVSLRPGGRPITEVTVEAIAGNDTVLSTPVTVPRPDETGTIRIVGELPTTGLGPGQYTLRVVANDGQAMASRTADVTLAP
jgi:VWFA-related protein